MRLSIEHIAHGMDFGVNEWCVMGILVKIVVQCELPVSFWHRIRDFDCDLGRPGTGDPAEPQVTDSRAHEQPEQVIGGFLPASAPGISGFGHGGLFGLDDAVEPGCLDVDLGERRMNSSYTGSPPRMIRPSANG